MILLWCFFEPMGIIHFLYMKKSSVIILINVFCVPQMKVNQMFGKT